MARDKAYRQAEKKIEQARYSGTTKLSLRYMKLTELPEPLGQLTQLQSLNLSSNQLTALPESLGQLSQLQEMDLSDNQLTALLKDKDPSSGFGGLIRVRNKRQEFLWVHERFEEEY